jgi:hypothetical protein
MRPYLTGNRLGLLVPGRGMYHVRELTDRYAIAAPSAASPASACVIFCIACVIISHNPNDVANRYCGLCHQFLDNKIRPMPASGEAVQS